MRKIRLMSIFRGPLISNFSLIQPQAAAFGFEKGPTGHQLKRRMINMMVHLKGRSAIVTCEIVLTPISAIGGDEDA
jgi:hypothetical protein